MQNDSTQYADRERDAALRVILYVQRNARLALHTEDEVDTVETTCAGSETRSGEGQLDARVERGGSYG